MICFGAGQKGNLYEKQSAKRNKENRDRKVSMYMENKKAVKQKTMTLKPGTTGHEILFLLKEYGYYAETKLQDLIPYKKPDTIRKVVRLLEISGYITRKKGMDGSVILALSKLGKEMLQIKENFMVNTPQKLSRMANLSMVTMMFHRSIPTIQRTENRKETFYQSKQEIIKEVPGCEKVLTASRLAGVYHHYGMILPVFKLGNTMFWMDNAERQVREYLEERIFHAKLNRAIFFVETYKKEAVKFLYQDENMRKNIGKSLRDSLELSSCYEKVFLFGTDQTGIQQLKLFRSIAHIEEMFLEAVFEKDQLASTPDSIVDGYIDDVKCIVLFTGDIVQIKKICRMLDAGMLEKIHIFCYDFQEPFLRVAFSAWAERVLYNSYTLEELKTVFHLE